MNQKHFALAALALALTTNASADLFGLGSAVEEDPGIETTVTVSAQPDAHWNFVASGSTSEVEHYSPNLDGIGFRNRSKCYGHSLLSTRWFQYLVKPLKNGTVSEITPDEFLDFWGGAMDRTINGSLTSSNIDNVRLQRFSTYDDASQMAIGRLVGYYHQYQSNDWDHDRIGYDDGIEFQEDLAETIDDAQLPPQLSLKRQGGGHAVNAYKVEQGTATIGNNGTGEAGTSVRAWKISLYDPNEPGTGDAADDADTETRRYLMVFENGGGFVGMSERMERSYGRYLRQGSNNPAGTWHIPADKYGIREDVADDGGEIRSGFWHWWNDVEEIDDAEARRISSLPAAD